jgi:protein-glutamine gamma-glutamyltransferase
MSQVFVIPRQCMAWMLFAQAVVMVPHIERLPLWILAAWGIAALWRLMIFNGRWSYPGTFIKIVLVAMVSAGVISGYKVKYGLEPAVALLLSGFALKLLEMKSRRDVLVITYLGFFAASLQLLFSQSIVSALYVLVSLLIVSSSLIALHQAAEQERWFAPLQKSVVMFAQSMPLLLAMFLVLPRLPPFWSVPMPSNGARTGMSDSMEPGNVTRLAQSDALAFRVTFDKALPPNHALYWRGIALGDFDGRRWQQSGREAQPQPVANAKWSDDADVLNYSIIMEATQQPWLFTIVYAQGDDDRLRYDNEFNIRYKEPIRNRLSLQIHSVTTARLDEQLSPYHRRALQYVPKTSNPQTQKMARQWREEVQSDTEYVSRVLNFFRDENFFYTLEPPPLGPHAVDDFLFSTRRGFCEHYASAFSVLMRAAGIPARVVVGYQGGARHEAERYVTVRQLDAHAWAEVWLEGRGWVMVDPTSAVAPQRIELGSDALKDDPGYLADEPFSPLKYSGVAWLQKLQSQYDYVNYLWHVWVLDYDNKRQFEVLTALLGEVSVKRIAIFFLACGGVTLALIAIGFWWRSPRHREKPAIKLFRRFERVISRHTGLQRNVNEGAIDFARRVVERRPDLAAQVDAISAQFNEIQYAADRPTAAQIDAFKKMVGCLDIKRPRLQRKR